MSKRSVAATEVETKLSAAVGAFGGLGDEQGTKVLAELMQDCEAADARELILKVVLATTDQHLLRLCISLGAIEKLSQWVQQHTDKPGREDKQILHTLLSCLNKMNSLMSLTQKTQTYRVVGDLCRHTDSSISSKATAIVAHWKKQSPIEELLKTNQTVKSRWTGNSVESLKHYTPRKLRWTEDAKLETFKFFYRTDEPTAECASLRPLQEVNPETKVVSLDDFRKRDDILTKKTTTTVYPSLTHLKLQKTMRPRQVLSQEAVIQVRREGDFAAATYSQIRDVPRAPIEAVGRAETCISVDTPVLPLAKKVASRGAESHLPVFSLSPPQGVIQGFAGQAVWGSYQVHDQRQRPPYSVPCVRPESRYYLANPVASFYSQQVLAGRGPPPYSMPHPSSNPYYPLGPNYYGGARK